MIALIRENSKDPTLYDLHAAATHSPFSSQSQDQVNYSIPVTFPQFEVGTTFHLHIPCIHVGVIDDPSDQLCGKAFRGRGRPSGGSGERGGRQDGHHQHHVLIHIHALTEAAAAEHRRVSM